MKWRFLQEQGQDCKSSLLKGEKVNEINKVGKICIDSTNANFDTIV